MQSGGLVVCSAGKTSWGNTAGACASSADNQRVHMSSGGSITTTLMGTGGIM